MSFKKLSRIATVAFVLAVLLAVSALAYGVAVTGKVTGLEDGVDYTYAQYDFATDAYGEFTELTPDTILTEGVWGIKAGDAEPEAVFVQGPETGYIYFWDTENNKPLDLSKGYRDLNVTDTYVPGKWSVSSINSAKTSGGAYNTTVSTYTDGSTYASVLTSLQKDYFLVFTKSEEPISGNKYRYTYFAYKGDTSETGYKYATEETMANFWLIGESNRLQESKVYYGFTNEQVVPTSAFKSFGFDGMSNGSVKPNENYGKGDYTPKLTLFVKTPGSTEIAEYDISVSADFGVPVTFEPSEDIPEGYIVGFALAPYDNLPDNYMISNTNTTDTTNHNTSEHIKFPREELAFEVTDPSYAAPTGLYLNDDNTVGGLVDGKYYQYANVSVGAGVELEYGEPTTLTSETEPVGLFAVRESNAEGTVGSAWSTPLFVEGGEYAVYHQIDGTEGTDKDCNGDGVTGGSAKVIEIQSLADNATNRATIAFTPEKWMGIGVTNYNICLSYPQWYNQYRVGTTGQFTKSVDGFNGYYYTYEFGPEEVIPMNTFGSFKFNLYYRQGAVKFIGTVKSIITFVVVTDDGELVERTVEKPITLNANGTMPTNVVHTVESGDFADNDGYIVGIIIYPYYIDGTIESTGAANPSICIDFFEDSWTVVEYVAEPTGLDIVDGKVQNLEAGRTYEYCQVIGGVDGEAQELTADTVVYGTIKVRVYSEKGTNAVSAWTSALVSDRTAPTGISFVDGKPVDLEEGILYQYKNITVGAGLAVEESAVAELTASSTGIYGLIKVREVNAAGTLYTEWSDIIYSAGEDVDLINPVEKEVTRAAGVTDPWTSKVYAKGDKVEVIDVADSGVDLGITMNIAYYPYPVAFATEKWVAVGTNGKSFTHNGLAAPYAIALPNVCIPVSQLVATEYNAWQADVTNADLKAAYDTAWLEKGLPAIQDFWYSYRLGNDEIIPMSDFGSHTFHAFRRQLAGTLTAPTGKDKTFIQAKYTLIVLTDEGIEQRSVFTEAFGNYAFATSNSDRYRRTVTIDDFKAAGYDTDGYIVGIVINPWGKIDPESTYKPTINATYPNGYSSDVGIEFFADGWVKAAPAVTPTVSFERLDTDEIEVTVTNAIEGLTYAYSTDNLAWTTLDAGVTSFTVDADTVKVYVKSLASGIVLESAVAEATIPAIKDTPELVLGADNSLTVEAGVYEIAKYAFGAEALNYQALTSGVLEAGIWYVREIGDATGLASDPQLIYVEGAEVGTVNFATKGSTADYLAGIWTHEKSITLYKYTTGSSWANQTEMSVNFNSGWYTSLADRRSKPVRYQFTDSEIIPLSEMANLKMHGLTNYLGYPNEGYTVETSKTENGTRSYIKKGQTMARVYVVGADVPYYDVVTDVTYSNGFDFNIATALEGKDGYVVAIDFYLLWSAYGADGETDLGDDLVYAYFNNNAGHYYESMTLKFRFAINDTMAPSTLFIENDIADYDGDGEVDAFPTKSDAEVSDWLTGGTQYTSGIAGMYLDGTTNRYALNIKKTVAETPVLELTAKNAVITVTNYNEAYEYAYSDDNGDTWVEFEGNSFNATKANTDYVVKVLDNAAALESAVSAAVTSPMVVYIGQSLVLDGQIAVRYYMDIADTENYTVNLNLTKCNTDDSSRLFYGSTLTSTTDDSIASKIQYNEEKDLYFTEIYVAAKDVDNVTFETSLGYWPVGMTESGNRITVATPGINVENYIADALLRAEEGEAEFVAAEPVVTMLQTYAKYADNYFSTADALDTYTSDAFAAATIDAGNCTDNFADLDFVGSSLLLEDNVTIRHYFKVVGDYTYTEGDYTAEGATIGTKNDGFYVYFDIVDVPAHMIGEDYTLTVEGAAGEGKADAGKVTTVTYSVANYLANAAETGTAKLVNLANVMYDYYVAADAYYVLTHSAN